MARKGSSSKKGLQSAMANNGKTGGRGRNKTAGMVTKAHMNAKTTRGPTNARRLGSGTPVPGKLP